MENTSQFATVQQFLDAVGRAQFQADLGHSAQTVSRAVTENVMPASWYRDVRDWCQSKGLVAPDHLFKWSKVSRANGKQNVNSAAKVQAETGMENPTSRGAA